MSVWINSLQVDFLPKIRSGGQEQEHTMLNEVIEMLGQKAKYNVAANYTTQKIKGTQYVKLSIKLGSISHCRSVSVALVQIKARTGAPERKQQDNPETG